MCGPPWSRNTQAGTAMAAMFDKTSSITIGRIYLQEISAGQTAMTWAANDDVDSMARIAHHKIGFNVQVHKYGAAMTGIDNPIMTSVALEALTSKAMCSSKLNIGVGQHGIIGRGLSIVDASGSLLGSGIVGWN